MKSYFKSILKKNLGLTFVMLVMMLLLVFVQAYSQTETDKEKNKPIDIPSKKSEITNTRSSRSFLSKDAKTLAGLDKYFRFTVHDGNLVHGGITNSGLLSYHYVSGNPTISWPKGVNSVSYIHSSVFYVAAEVIDTHGDTIHIVSDNYRRSNSEVSSNYTHMYAFMPLPRYFNLDHPTAIDIPEIYGISEDVGVDGVPNTGDFGESDGILQAQEDFNDNDELDLSMQNEVGWFAISHRKETWPEYWPPGSYYGDDRLIEEERPGVRAGRWNGEYGAYIRASQESYYVMDDSENDEFEYYPFDDTRAWPNGRRGLGVTVEARNYQWNARLAEDIFICIYDITNHGKDLDKCVVGMYVDPDMGGSLSGDDASFDRQVDITYAWNISMIDEKGLPMGYFGFAFLESPGLSNDGIDNDEDGMVDEYQANGIDDDHDWVGWLDMNGNGVYDNEDLNYNDFLDEGEDLNGNGKIDFEPLNDDLGSDGLGPEYDEYTGPDPDGSEANGLPDNGEPNYEFTDNDESDQIGLTSWYLRDVDNTMADDDRYWRIEIMPGTFEIREGYQRDIAWSYGSGFVGFSGEHKSHRYAISLLFGNDIADILRNKKTMQVIYDNDYNFSKPPKQPLLSATADDGRVYLKWDDQAERSRDPIYGRDFEAYYIYKSTEPSFGDIKTITDGFGSPLLFKQEAIYDLKNGLTGLHPVRLGIELGEEFDLGVSYNMGTDSGLRHFYVDTTVTNGRTYYYAVVSVDRGYHPNFYPELTDREGLAVASPTECAATIQTDPLGRPISADPNTATVIPTEKPAGWVQPGVDNDIIDHIAGNGTGSIEVTVVNPLDVKTNHKYRVTFGDDGSFEVLDSVYTGNTDRMTLESATNGDGIALASLSDPETNEYADEFIYDGFLVTLHNDTTDIDTTYWEIGSSALDVINMTYELRGKPVHRNYEFRVLEAGADTSVNSNRITNFQIWDVTDPQNEFKLPYRYTPRGSFPDSLRLFLKENDRIIIVNNRQKKKHLWKFDLYYPSGTDSSAMTVPQNGDVFKIFTKKAFDRNDTFEFSMTGNDIDIVKAKNDLDDIYTVPDPYVAVSILERKIINLEEGRGDRRIDFVNLPKECTISIFTASGKFVRQLEHTSDEDKTRASWDLRTKDGLEITHGVYFYVVEAPGIGKKIGKLGVIK
jgi:hypothetical protein